MAALAPGVGRNKRLMLRKVEFSLLGPLEVSDGGAAIPIRRGLPRSLLIYLLLHRRVPVAGDVLADRLWSGTPPTDAGNAVQRVVSYLRRTLGDPGHQLLATRAAGYALLATDDDVDAVRFERLVQRAVDSAGAGTATGAQDAVADARTALTLWRGDPLSDVVQQEWSLAETARLIELRTQVQSVGLAALLHLNRADEAVAQARALVTEHPLQEQFHQQLMVALYRSGRQSEALAAYATARRMLDQELGLDPGPQLKLLERQVLEQSTELEWMPPPDWSSSPAGRRDVVEAGSTPESVALPVPLTSLVGRDAALRRLDQLLTTARVLTLTGLGGVGKSRLALELARRDTTRPVWWVHVEVVSEAELVAPTVARAVGASTPPHGDHIQAVARSIGDGPALLVLDGCEQVAAAAAELVDKLHRQCPSLTQVITSRRPLRVAGEVTWAVPPLALPPDGDHSVTELAGLPSVQLFQQRAQAARPDFTVDAGNAADLASLVVALDGLPLAIELAAAQSDVLPPAEIRRRLADRFALLQSEQWDAPARQHTLRAAIDSSAALLTVEERDHWQQLGVFAGSFDLEAVEALTGSAAATAYRLTASLVRQSLVTPVDGGRFRLLESVRTYALEDLEHSSRLPEVRDRLANYLLTFVTAADHGLHGPNQQEWLVRLRATVPDLRAALDWLLGGADPSRGALLAAISTWFWTREGMLDEAAWWMETAAAVPLDDASVRAAVLHGWGRIHAPLGELAAARDACQASVALSSDLGDDAALARTLVTLGLCEWGLGDLSAAARSHDEAAARAEAAADRWHRDVALVLRLRTAVDAGEPDVEERLERVLSRLRANGDPHVVGLALGQRARLGVLSGDANRAQTTAEASLLHWRTTGYREGELQALNLLARASVRTGRLDQAADDARTAVLTAATLGHRGALFEGLETLAAVHHAAGRDHEARELLILADRERSAAGIPVPAGDRATVDELHRAFADRLHAADSARTTASARDLDQLIAELREGT